MNTKHRVLFEIGLLLLSDEIDTVFANMADFYFGAVSIGKCDLRLLLKIGDKG